MPMGSSPIGDRLYASVKHKPAAATFENANDFFIDTFHGTSSQRVEGVVYYLEATSSVKLENDLPAEICLNVMQNHKTQSASGWRLGEVHLSHAKSTTEMNNVIVVNDLDDDYDDNDASKTEFSRHKGLCKDGSPFATTTLPLASTYSDFALKILSKMGHVPGTVSKVPGPEGCGLGYSTQQKLNTQHTFVLHTAKGGFNVFLTGPAGTGLAGVTAIALGGQRIPSFTGMGVPQSRKDFEYAWKKKKQWRQLQDDTEFARLLHHLQKGIVTDEVVSFLQQYARPLPPNQSGILPITLHSKIKDVTMENMCKLCKLPGNGIHTFWAVDGVSADTEAPYWAH
eukprot:9168348-Ditylum_brightwellii.AAC.1